MNLRGIEVGKPWKSNRDAAVISGYLGARGIQTSRIKSVEELLAVNAAIFGINPSLGLTEAAARTKQLSPPIRKARFRAAQADPNCRYKHLFTPQGHYFSHAHPADSAPAPMATLVVPTVPRPKLKISRQTPSVSDKEIREFYDSWEWRRLSYEAKVARGRACECCGARPPDVRIHTDHIKPIRLFWHLRLEWTNLQILCEDCNKGKGSRDDTDFRRS